MRAIGDGNEAVINGGGEGDVIRFSDLLRGGPHRLARLRSVRL